MEAAREFPYDQDHPHVIICQVDNEKALHKTIEYLRECGVRYRTFVEPDRNDETTALATEILYGEQRKILRKYQLLRM